jgi:ABC-type transporter Mla subunit MlaD
VTERPHPARLWRRLVFAAVPVLVLAALAAGCGGGSSSSSSTSAAGSTSTQQWADDFCSAVTTWESSITQVTDSLKGGGVTKDDLEQAANDVQSASKTFVDDLKGLGTPDTESGQQAKESLDQLTNELSQDETAIENAVKNVSGVAEVLTAVSSVASTLATMSTQLKSTYDELQQLDAAGELKSAFENAGSCGGLTASGS